MSNTNENTNTLSLTAQITKSFENLNAQLAKTVKAEGALTKFGSLHARNVLARFLEIEPLPENATDDEKQPFLGAISLLRAKLNFSSKSDTGVSATTIKLFEKMATILDKYPNELREVLSTSTKIKVEGVTIKMGARVTRIHGVATTPCQGQMFNSMTEISKFLDLVEKLGKGVSKHDTVAIKEKMTPTNFIPLVDKDGKFKEWALRLNKEIPSDKAVLDLWASEKENATMITNPVKLQKLEFDKMVQAAKKSDDKFKKFEGLDYIDAQIAAFLKARDSLIVNEKAMALKDVIALSETLNDPKTFDVELEKFRKTVENIAFEKERKIILNKLARYDASLKLGTKAAPKAKA